MYGLNRNMKNIRILSENFQCLVVTYSLILNRRVFIMVFNCLKIVFGSRNDFEFIRI